MMWGSVCRKDQNFGRHVSKWAVKSFAVFMTKRLWHLDGRITEIDRVDSLTLETGTRHFICSDAGT